MTGVAIEILVGSLLLAGLSFLTLLLAMYKNSAAEGRGGPRRTGRHPQQDEPDHAGDQ